MVIRFSDIFWEASKKKVGGGEFCMRAKLRMLEVCAPLLDSISLVYFAKDQDT